MRLDLPRRMARLRASGVVAAGALVIAAEARAAVPGPTLRLFVRVHDAYGTPAPELAGAHEAVARLLSPAGILVEWLDCSIPGTRPRADECRLVLRAGELVLHLRGGPPGGRTLGYAYVDVERREGALATVLVDRVQALADAAAVDRGELLGRAIVHELVHLLLGSVAHARSGLMRASWQADELRRDRLRSWSLSQEERARLRRGLQTRLPGSLLAAGDGERPRVEGPVG
jgi:hypothetical protein